MVREYCDVCGREGPARLSASSLGPVSLCYCKECVDRNAEPLLLVGTAIFMRGGLESLDKEDLSSFTTFDDGEYRDLDYVIGLYPEMEGSIREAFFDEPDER